jgi:exodeoxyribonuclease VII large subunit
LAPHQERLHRSTQRLLPSTVRIVERQRVELVGLDLQLRALSPQATLDRGYALVTDAAGQVIRTSPPVGTPVQVRVQSGRFHASVEDIDE